MKIAFGITRPCQAQPFGCLDICTSLYSFSTLVLILATVARSQVWHLQENNTIKAGGSTKRAQNVGVDGWSGWTGYPLDCDDY